MIENNLLFTINKLEIRSTKFEIRNKSENPMTEILNIIV
jgi:hypothetical protein